MKDEDLERASPAFRYALDMVGPRRDPALTASPTTPAPITASTTMPWPSGTAGTRKTSRRLLN